MARNSLTSHGPSAVDGLRRVTQPSIGRTGCDKFHASSRRRLGLALCVEMSCTRRRYPGTEGMLFSAAAMSAPGISHYIADEPLCLRGQALRFIADEL